MSTHPNFDKELDSELPARLRDWTEAQFEQHYHSDRFTAMVLANRLRYTVDHMSTGLMFSAFSPIIRDWYDFAITISGPPDMDYPMPAVSNSLVVFLGTMEDGVRNVVEECGVDKLKPGDVLLCNDPYRSGNHVNDALFIRPVFHEGRPIAFVNARAHQLDMGGIAPGGFSATKANVYENGLVIAPMLLFEHDKPVRSTFSLVFDNTRMAGLLQPDFMTMAEQLKLGERLVSESIARYGEAAYRGAVRYCCDASAEAMADALERIPDGDYAVEEALDADGAGDDEPLVVRAKVIKRGRRVEVDCSGSSRQARTCINAGPLDAKTAVGVALKFLVDRETPFTSGAYRPIDVVVPPGTLVSAMPPDGAIMIYWEVTQCLVSGILREVGKAIGEDAFGGDFGGIAVHNAHGVNADGSAWQNIGLVGGEHGPWGGDKRNDGDSYVVTYMIDGLDPAVEGMEQETPVLQMRKEFVIDSAGPGYNRGGAGVVKDARWESAGDHYALPLRYRYPPGFGAAGGGAGVLGGCWFFDADDPGLTANGGYLGLDEQSYIRSTPIAGVVNPDTNALDPNGEYAYFGRQPVWHTEAGAYSRYITNGGGGWGDPFTREPERVLADVRNEYVSIEGAARDYGVVIVGDPQRDPEGLQIDKAATQALRRSHE